MYDLALCVEVLCAGEWSTSLKLVDQPGTSWRKFRCKTPGATFATCISITYFTNQGNSHVLHNQNQANVTIMRRETSLTAWQSTSKIEPLIGTCSRKQNFPCDDQICIDNIVIESKTSGLNLQKKMHKRSWGTIFCVTTNPQGTCSKITFTGAESKFLSLFSNIFFHNAIDIITLSVWVTSA